MANEKTYDVFPQGGDKFAVMTFGSLEHTFGLSLSSEQMIRMRKVRSKKTGEVMTLRYVIYPQKYIQTETERLEAWIAKNYDEY